MNLLPAFLILAQSGVDPVPSEPVPPQDPPIVHLLVNGAIEAPAQPSRASSASVDTGERSAPAVPTRIAQAIATPVRSLVAVRGQEDNVVIGVGLVVGLSGTGDTSEAAKILQQNVLRTQNLNLELQSLSSKNMAVVLVEALLPAGIKPGRAVDVRVSSIGDAKSLQGGVLLLTELTDMTGTVVYATASGPVMVGGFSVESDAASATKNHVTVAELPGGGKVEREVPTRVVSETGSIYLDARPGQDSFGNVVRITEAINALYPRVAATMPDGKSIRVQVPGDLPEDTHMAFLDTLLDREIVSENLARVIVNERTGVVVMGGDVRLRPGVITKGNLTVTVAETAEASQPGPLSTGQTQVLPRSEVNVEEGTEPLVLIPGAATLEEVVDVLNVMGATPRDLITILTAMSDAGMLVAEVRRL